MTKQEILDSHNYAELRMRMVIYDSYKELIGYHSATEVIASVRRQRNNKDDFSEKKNKALQEALPKVLGFPYLKKGVVTRITTPEDVELSIKELLRASGIKSSVEDFILELTTE